jgi:integrase
MSIRKRPDRPLPYAVIWREAGHQRSRSFLKERDAKAFDLDIRRRKQLGPLAGTVLVSRITLAEFVETEWWPRYAIPNLAPDTRRRYLEVWGHDLLPRVGGYPLRELTPMIVEDLRDQLARAGLGGASQRKALLLLSGILKRAVVRGLIPVNPVSMIQMPKAPPTSRPQPLSPDTIERIRALLRHRDAILVSLLAYGGLRPAEALTARWGHLNAGSLYVLASKTGQERHVDILAPLATDLAEWRMAQGRPADHQFIFPATSSRNSGGERHWNNWRRRVYEPAAVEAGVTGDLRPYRLRGSFVSLLLWSGMDLVEVADQAGHSVATLSRHYAGVVRDLRGQPRVPAADAIRQAREQRARKAI